MTPSLSTGADPTALSTTGLSALSAHSRFVQRLRRRYPAELALLPAGAPRRADMQAAYDVLRARGDASCVSW
jgi:glutamate-ammonia-ligase adenylyltransferase